MSVNCSFILNSEPLSQFKVNLNSYQAFSGMRNYVNKPMHICLVDNGPIPIGRYYIVDRESGGMLGWLKDHISGKDEWFALYAKDHILDDYTFCNEVKRGHFRLHPKDGLGISKGCITIQNKSDFRQIRNTLLNTSTFKIPNSSLIAYGEVVVL